MEYSESNNLGSGNGFELKEILEKYFKYWSWFIFSLVIFLLGAFIYLKITPEVYKTSASIIIKDEESKSSPSASEVSTFVDIGALSGMSSKVENEIGILKSRRMMENVVRALNLNVKYFSSDSFREQELYGEIPVDIEVLKIDNSNIERELFFELMSLNEKGVVFKNSINGTLYDLKFDSVESIGVADVVIKRNNRVEPKDFKFRVETFESVAMFYANSLNVDQVTENATLLDLSLNGEISKKSEDILNQLIREYNKEAIEDKNIVARNTRDFINERLEVINQELDSVELGKENFKESNKLTDIQAESELYINNASDYRKKLFNINSQIQLVNDFINYLNKEDNSLTLPSNLEINGESISPLIEDYNMLVLRRNRLLSNSTTENPAVMRLNSELSEMRDMVAESLNRLKSNLMISLNDVYDENKEIVSEISSIPSKERMFRGIIRQQDIKEKLYLYLLQKREENSLSLAVKAPKAKIVDNAFSSSKPVSPNKKIIYLLSLVLGFTFPVIFIYIRDSLRTTVQSKIELNGIANDEPFLGQLPSVSKMDSGLIEENDRSVLAEAFRMLLTNLQYLLVKKIRSREEGVTAFVTSTVKGEGKTFVSFNLAMTMANTGKKVLIVGADLRNPQLQRYQKGAKQMRGLSDYLVDSNLTVDMVINSSELNKNLDFLPSGSIPPNPSELLQLKRTDDLFEILRKQYDYIIVDTAPSMVVADTFLINHLADVTIHVVRAKYTDKKLVQFAVDSKREGKLKNLAFVLNDVDSADFGYYGSKYGYAYGYGNEHQSLFSRIKNRFR